MKVAHKFVRFSIDGQLSHRAGAVALFAGLGTTLGLEAVAVLRAHRTWLIHRMPDDAFYYLEIGRNIASQGFASFDGIHSTNGFHPLWQALVALLAVIFPATTTAGDAFAKAVLLLNIVCVAASALLTWAIGRRILPPLIAAAAPLGLCVFSGQGALIDGMESSVVVLTLWAIAFAMCHAIRQPGPYRDALFGLACATWVLARIDNVAIVFIFPAVVAATRRSARGLNWWLVGFCLLLVPFFGWNLATNEMLLTVSGSIKVAEGFHRIRAEYGHPFSTAHIGGLLSDMWAYAAYLLKPFGRSLLTWQWPVTGIVYGLVVSAIGGAALLASVASLIASRASAKRVRAGVVAVATCLLVLIFKAAQDVFLVGWQAATVWYSAPQRALLGVGLAASVAAVLSWLGRCSWPGVVAAGVLAIVLLTPLDTVHDLRVSDTLITGNPWPEANMEAVEWIRQSGPIGRYGSPDSGILGFYLHGQVEMVNLDGLVNSKNYATKIMNGIDPAVRYRGVGVRYLVARLSPERPVDPGCGRVLWESRTLVPSLVTPDVLPVKVIDLERCWAD